MRMAQRTVITALLILVTTLSACGNQNASSGGRTTQTAASEESATSAASATVYTNSSLGIRIEPGDGFETYTSADSFAKTVRGEKWNKAFGSDNHFLFGYRVSSEGKKGYFYGYRTDLSEEEQDYDLSDFVSAVELSVQGGDVQENGSREIGNLTWQELDISGDDGTQEILYLTKYRNAIYTIVIGQMEDAPIEELCLAAVQKQSE